MYNQRRPGQHGVSGQWHSLTQVPNTYQRAACPGPGRTGGRPWCKIYGHTAPAGHHHRSGSTHPLTASSLPPWLCASWFSSWLFCPFPLKRGMLRSRMKKKHNSLKRIRQTQVVIKKQTTKRGPKSKAGVISAYPPGEKELCLHRVLHHQPHPEETKHRLCGSLQQERTPDLVAHASQGRLGETANLAAVKGSAAIVQNASPTGGTGPAQVASASELPTMITGFSGYKRVPPNSCPSQKVGT